MKVIAVASQKGGCGKSTVSRHGAVLLPDSVLLDLDPQGTTNRWLERRKGNDIRHPRAIIATVARAPEAIERARQMGFKWLVVDTPPEHDDQRAIRAAIEASDLVLIPCKPSPDDMDVIPKTIRLAKDAGKPFVVVMTMVKRSRYSAGAIEYVRGLVEKAGGKMAPVTIGDRVAYVESVHHAEAVTEYEPTGAAASEMKLLWDWVADMATLEEEAK